MYFLAAGSFVVHKLSLVAVSRGYSLIRVCGLLIVMVSLVARVCPPEREGFSNCGMHPEVAECRLWNAWASAIMEQGRSCPWHAGF